MVWTFHLSWLFLSFFWRLTMHYDSIDKNVKIIAFDLSLIFIFSFIGLLRILSMRPFLFLVFFTWFFLVNQKAAVISDQLGKPLHLNTNASKA
jgi:glucan phosphoethanolaminetransferase (alkaline phosphatase superfamily)